ncbi:MULTISPECIES: flagellar basal body-associated FliL family protein [Exiguobacterium]|uniref:Flagellar protein FliL n=1 Tax=Exiguobacterium oxidotolerans TaxID=223958 RepID=A0A653ICQ5_9BACL|nr:MULTISPECIES: flagellar basal body-associated FliL family protein [Exiguobacterium]ASI35734.1 flagellar basal body protein FliL [Exiguobacterium sp. N4-1P]VWX36880.1 Flagellar protein FliL [Exiguobacterium oxidotolerans]
MAEEKKKSKLKIPLIMVIVALMMIGAGYMLTKYWLVGDETEAKVEQPTGAELEERSFQTDDLTTNIADERFLNVQFTIVTDDVKTKEELELRKFQINNIILGDLASMKKQDLDSKQDMAKLEEKLRGQFKKLLQEGDVQRVYTTKKIIQ